MVALMQNNISNQLKAIAFPNIQQLTEGFTGRSQILNEIDHWLQQKDQRFFILTGEPGVGKSAIAAHLTQTREDIVAYHFCQLGDNETVCPSRVLRSLAAQLDKAFHYYSEALFNTIKSTLSGEAHINIDKIEDLEDGIQSTVKQFKINNVNTSDIANELDILIRAPLAALPELYEKHGKEPPELAIILIDGLDVAVTMEAGVQEDEDLATLFAALSEDESLPSWVRFLFTTRPDRRVLREFEPLKPYLLDERSEENLADIRQYVNQRLSSTTLKQQVAVTPMEAQGWVEQLTERSQGNFRYIKSLLDDLEAERCSLNALSALPLGMKESYAKDFAQRFPEDEWSDRHDLILRTLAEAEHPLTEDELATLTKILPRQLRQDLWGLRQFLDVDLVRFCWIAEKKEDHYETYETFVIFHQSLKEYLITRSPAVTHS
jgi:hypothetical protein